MGETIVAWVMRAVGTGLVGLVLLAGAALAQPENVPGFWLADAELAGVAFIDADRGWAVGDRGVIWHTADGGRTWRVQPSGVTCRLEHVQFLDAENGFVVGGWTQPYTHQTLGVVLRTRDGGKTWHNTPDLTLPGLKFVRFFDVRHGIAIGNGSPLYPAGVFRSEDGGRTWTPLPKGQTAGWAAGDFRNPTSGALAGIDGTLAIATSNEIRPSRSLGIGTRPLEKMVLTGPTGGWLVGAGGLVLTTNDGGLTWTAPSGPLPEEATRQMDFRAIAAMGSNVWVAGAPGSSVLHSADGGQTWQTLLTGSFVPLRGLAFIDEYRGWAVGALGTILHTRDGGRSWRVQRAGGTRVALLNVFGEARRLPLEVIAEQAGNAGFLTAIEVIGREQPRVGSDGRETWSLPGRMQSAVVATGGSAADLGWRFPLPPMALSPTGEAILSAWNQANDGQGTQRLEEHLVRRIRQWRPEVVLTDEVSPRGENPLAHLTNQVTLAAVNKAGDESAYSEQIKILGLSAWRVKKVFAVLPSDKQGVVNVTPSMWAERLGRSLAEQAEAGRGMIECDVSAASRNIGLKLWVDRLPQDSGKRDIMSGIVLAPGSEARRQLSDPPAGDLKRLADVAQKRHNVEQLLARIDATSSVGAGWMGQVRDLTEGLGSKAAGEVLWQLGRKYQQGGKLLEAAEAMDLLLSRHPQHPLADAAARWLVQYYASGEVAWRMRKETKFEVRVATAVQGSERAVTQDGPGGVRPANFAGMGATGTAAPQMTPVERAGRALAIAKQIEQTRPTLYAEPALRFAVAAAARQSGQGRSAERWFQTLTAGGTQNVWAQNAAAEQWLFRPTENGPKKVCAVVTAAQKPRLDGRLDDAIWQTAKAVSLRSEPPVAGETPAVVAMAYDDEFLYLAISCARMGGPMDVGGAGTRVADTDQSGQDRVSLLLDVDRDYSSHWTLTVDCRGWPAESCFGDKTWNPEWFIAAGGDERFWTVEAAVPLSELAPAKPKVRDVWAVGIQRVMPGVGFQSFSTPAAVEVMPEGMGLLVFE